MSKLMIFLPENLKNKWNVPFCGDVEFQNDLIVFYVLCGGQTNAKKCKIGVLTENVLSEISEPNFVEINYDNGKYDIASLFINGKSIHLFLLNSTVIVFYDEKAFISCEKLSEKGNVFRDHCANLEKKLRSLEEERKKTVFLSFLAVLLIIISFLQKCFQTVMPFWKYSSIGLHINLTIERWRWVLRNIIDNRKLSVMAINFIASVALDISLGVCCLAYLSSVISLEDFPRIFLWTAEAVVASLRSLLHWMVGSPAGFKLNLALNNILGGFYLFHTEIWWLFLASISPYLGIAVKIFTILGQLGITAQAAILSDLLALVSFHVYCIYAYAARLYNIQLAGLISLWRLFLGRKRNPLRDKVDSCHYSADQLFVGTLLFTIALFLLPTTLLYYVVFTSIRLLILSVGGMLTWLSKFLHALPLYSSILWCLSSSKVSTEVRMEPYLSLSYPDITVVRLRRVPGEFIATMKNFIPDCIETPSGPENGILGFLKQITKWTSLWISEKLKRRTEEKPKPGRKSRRQRCKGKRVIGKELNGQKRSPTKIAVQKRTRWRKLLTALGSIEED